MDTDYAQAAQAKVMRPYATLGAGQGLTAIPTPPHFEGLHKLAERADLVEDRLQRFLDRFHGSPVSNAATSPPTAPGYLGQIVRLSDTISRLENVASAIDAIG